MLTFNYIIYDDRHLKAVDLLSFSLYLSFVFSFFFDFFLLFEKNYYLFFYKKKIYTKTLN